MLPDSVIEPLKEHLLRVKRLHQEDLVKGLGAASISPMRWIGNTPMRPANGAGSMSSPRRVWH